MIASTTGGRGRPRRVKREIFCRPLSLLQHTDTYIVFDASAGVLVEMNAAARRIYHLCDGNLTVRDIARELDPDGGESGLQKITDCLLGFEQRGWIEFQKQSD